MDILCCKCKKRPAMLFVAKFDGKEMVNEGYCLKCASELGLPQVQSMMDSMGITPEDLENFDEQLDGLDNGMFELGGAETMPPFIQKMFGNIAPRDEEGEDSFDDSSLPAEIPDEEPRTSRTQNKKESRKDRQKRKYLDNFCTNLNEKAREHKMDRIVGRDAEIYRVVPDSQPPAEEQPLSDR